MANVIPPLQSGRGSVLSWEMAIRSTLAGNTRERRAVRDKAWYDALGHVYAEMSKACVVTCRGGGGGVGNSC